MPRPENATDQGMVPLEENAQTPTQLSAGTLFFLYIYSLCFFALVPSARSALLDRNPLWRSYLARYSTNARPSKFGRELVAQVNSRMASYPRFPPPTFGCVRANWVKRGVPCSVNVQNVGGHGEKT